MQLINTYGLKRVSSSVHRTDRGIIGFTFRGTVIRGLNKRSRKKKKELKTSEGSITWNLQIFKPVPKSAFKELGRACGRCSKMQKILTSSELKRGCCYVVIPGRPVLLFAICLVPVTNYYAVHTNTLKRNVDNNSFNNLINIHFTARLFVFTECHRKNPHTTESFFTRQDKVGFSWYFLLNMEPNICYLVLKYTPLNSIWST